MSLIKSKLQKNLSDFLENFKKYPENTEKTSELWKNALLNFLEDGSPENTTLKKSTEIFKSDIYKIFNSYSKTIREFTDKFENAIYQLHLNMADGFLPKYTLIPKSIKPNLFYIFNSYGRRISVPLSEEIYKFFFNIELLEIDTNKIIFYN